jgi:glycerol-3-phosphate O-acyltransferase
MLQTIEIPIWLFALILLFAAVTFASHFLFPSVRWYFRRRLERAVKKLNERLTRPIEPFKLARRYDMIQRIIYDPEVTKAIVDYAAEHNVPENVGFEKARSYAREIVPSFSAFTYFGFGIRIARWLTNALYDVRTGRDHDERLGSLPKDATVIFIMNHRSNMDYLLVTYLAAQASALSYAVGEWARVWPLTRLIKSLGAYFIRRKSRGALYRKVLARYVQMATDGGVTQAVFPEGGLTLDGKLRPPKMGLLTYVLDAYEPEGRDILFVPVAINYDRVLEDRVLIAADQRGDRRFGGKVTVVFKFVIRKLWQRLTGRFLRFGKAAVVFGEPISINSYGAKPDPERLATDLMHEISSIMPVLEVPLMCRVVLEADKPMSADAMLSEIRSMAIQCTGKVPQADSDGFGAMVEQARLHLEHRKIIQSGAQGWTLNEDERHVARFYANSISHFFPENAASAK